MPAVNVDQILQHPEYNLRSKSRLSARDDTPARIWLDGPDPLYAIYFRLRKRRVARRKEFYEAAFLLDRLAPELHAAHTVYEMAAGHGMFGMFAAVMYRNLTRVLHVDSRRPQSYGRMLEYISGEYPFIKLRSRYHEATIAEGPPIPPGALVVGLHCCGVLTDQVVTRARAAGAAFAVVPCCENRCLLPGDQSVVKGSDIPRVVNDMRAERWQSWGYDIEERELPRAVTECRRILIGRPARLPAVGQAASPRLEPACSAD